MKIAAAYIRVSSDDQLEYSPDSQVKAILDYAKAHDYVVPPEFIFREQDGRSGRSAQKRPEFIRMIGIAKKQPVPFEAILCWKYSRFARNQEESIVYKSMLRKNHVEVISISEPTADGPWGGLIERIIEWMDEYYSIRLSGEVKRGMKERLSRGEPLSVAPFGYKMENSNYVPDDKEAVTVKWIFDSFASGVSMRSIARKLNNDGFRTHRGGAFEVRTIEYIINNPVYLGKIRWSENGRIRRDYNNPNAKIVDGSHRPLISQELWDAAQEKNARNKRMYQPHSHSDDPINLMLKGIARCDVCGSVLVSGGGHHSKGYQCSMYNKGACKVSHYILADKLENAVINQIEADAISSYSKIRIETDEQKGSLIAEDITAQIKKQQAALVRCKEAYQAGYDTLEEYGRNKSAITAKIDALKASIPDPAPSVSMEDFRSTLRDAVPVLRDPMVSLADKNALLRTFVRKIVYSKANPNITIFYYA